MVKDARVLINSFPDNFEADQTPLSVVRMFSLLSGCSARVALGDGAAGAAIRVERRTARDASAFLSTETRRRRPNRHKLAHQLTKIDRALRRSRKPAR